MVDEMKAELILLRPKIDEKTVETEVTVLGKLLKENRILNPEAEVYHNGIFLKNNTEVLNVR